jgi:hypothetical protein
VSRRTTIKLNLLSSLLLCASACQQVAAPQGAKAVPRASQKSAAAQKPVAQADDVYGPPSKLGILEYKEIKESSGIAASRTTPGLYWTHNDSGDGPFLYAFDDRGHSRGVWRVTGASARDWEDIAAGPGPEPGRNYLYIGDIGDNAEARTEIVVYRVPEPVINPADVAATKSKPQSTQDLESIRLRYPDGKHDAEALLIHPVTGNLYIVIKIEFGPSIIYEATAPLGTGETTTMVRVGELNVPSLFGGIITGADISPDGLRIVLCDYVQGYEIVLPDARGEFNRVWQQPLKPIMLGKRKQGEAIAYRLDGKALLTTSEGKHSPLNQVVRR